MLNNEREVRMMNHYNPKDPFVVKLKRGQAFGVEDWSCRTRKEALELASSFCNEDPDWVRVVNRKRRVVYTFEQVQTHHDKRNEELGIKELTFGVNVEFVGSHFETEIVPLS